MLKNLRKKQEGFTIIEVMIVLAIAGLIILIVFLAVPALQRNARNTQRKNDVSSLLGAVTEYANNNSGNLPAQYSDFSGLAKLSYYNSAGATITWKGAATGANGANPPTNPNNPDTILIFSNAICGVGGDGTATNASVRSVVALYTVEGAGGGLVKQCQAS